MQPSNTTVTTPSQPESGITPSATSNLIYVLGTIGYDFGTEARRDSFKQLMPAVNMDGTLVPANPYDARQLVDYLDANPTEAKSLIWTINQELTPIYALQPVSSFAADVYEMLLIMLAGQLESQESDEYVERVSLPARLTGKKVTLFSGQTAKDRALNFSVTNAFQAATSFARAVATGMELDTIEVEKSPFCRVSSNCWDIKLKFFDPENGLRARKVYLFTVDVVERIPVTLGEIRSWSEPKN
ncbi:hypothetical protein MC7420_7585 [Coleofasciculus chthonoplastes PCC 7420]|uniref:PatG C-terminal domain-containing protein n=1 Tax=Coleofasciculus chthonoplastes PCC 7420 TaxID=118168 RepID=B4W186_9CYAN|nr:hypothetical protein MC7420_7585 [Coleofasciculus chthonoplastes PCC 7420]